MASARSDAEARATPSGVSRSRNVRARLTTTTVAPSVAAEPKTNHRSLVNMRTRIAPQKQRATSPLLLSPFQGDGRRAPTRMQGDRLATPSGLEDSPVLPQGRTKHKQPPSPNPVPPFKGERRAGQGGTERSGFPRIASMRRTRSATSVSSPTRLGRYTINDSCPSGRYC